MTDNQKKVEALKWMLNKGGGNRVWFNQLRKRWRERKKVNPFSSNEWSKLVEFWEAAPSSDSVQPSGCTAEREAAQEYQPRELPPSAAPTTQVTKEEVERIAVTHGLVPPSELIKQFPRQSSWSPRLVEAVQSRLHGQYLFDVVDATYHYVTSRCPNDPRIVMIILLNLIGCNDPLRTEIMRLYPDLNRRNS